LRDLETSRSETEMLRIENESLQEAYDCELSQKGEMEIVCRETVSEMLSLEDQLKQLCMQYAELASSVDVPYPARLGIFQNQDQDLDQDLDEQATDEESPEKEALLRSMLAIGTLGQGNLLALGEAGGLGEGGNEVGRAHDGEALLRASLFCREVRRMRDDLTLTLKLTLT